jgi:hypothetical protein
VNSILLYIEPEETERQQMVQMAADLVEALTLPSENLGTPPQSIGIIAEPSACLEIGLSMLGRGETRTVEGGERRASPLKLFPFVTDRSWDSGEIGLMNSGETERDEYGTLDDLALFGAIEQDPESPFEKQVIRGPRDVLERILQLKLWQNIVVFASEGNELEQIQPRTQTDTRIVYARRLDVNKERIPKLLELLEPTQDEETRQVRSAAVMSALQFEGLLSRLKSVD